MKELNVSSPQYEILTSTKQRILSLAGQGGGKSHMGGLISGEFIVNYPEMRGFIGANTYSQLSKSTLDRIFTVWKNDFGWANGVHYVVDKIPPFEHYGSKLKDYSGTIVFNNGCMIFTASLDNYKAIDGTQFCWAILDETKDTKEEAVKEVITGRLRQMGLWVDKDGTVYNSELKANGIDVVAWNPLYILTSPAKVAWINEWFELSDKYEEISKRIFSKTDFYNLETSDKKVVIYSTYHNEDNLPSNYIEQRKKDLAGSPNLIDMLIYGSPIAKSGGEFFSQFSRMKHVKDVKFIDNVPVHVSLDFNVTPYITMTCWQIINNDGVFTSQCFDELCLKSPKNNTEDLCRELIQKHLSTKKIPALFYYGDASGNNRSTQSKEHNFQILERVLSKYLNYNSNRVHKRNPAIISTRDFMNKIFVEGLPIKLLIDNSCRNLIADFEFMKESPDGGKMKTMAKDENTGSTYEKYGHCFAAGTMIETLNGEVAIENIVEGDYVLTRNGHKKVLRSWLSKKNANVKTYTFGNKKITCTDNHKFYKNGLFKIVLGLIQWDIICIFDKQKNSICKKKLSNLKEENFTDIQVKDIIGDGLKSIQYKQKPIYIDLFGWINSVKFRKVIIFIIRTAIVPIMILKTLNALILKFIYKIITNRSPKNKSNLKQNTLSREQYQPQRLGIVQKKGLSGIEIMLKKVLVKTLSTQMLNALYVINNILQKGQKGLIGFAQEIVQLWTEGEVDLIMKIEDVLLVVRSLVAINIQSTPIVQNNAENQDVYDLEIEHEHEFFANGMLVHNCSDSAIYFFISAFNNYFKPEN